MIWILWLKRNWEIPATVVVIGLIFAFCSFALSRAEAKGESRANAKWELKALQTKLRTSEDTLKLTQDNAAAANTYAQAVITREREWVKITGRLKNEISKPIYRDCAITDDARLLHDAAVNGSSAKETGDPVDSVPATNAPSGQQNGNLTGP